MYRRQAPLAIVLGLFHSQENWPEDLREIAIACELELHFTMAFRCGPNSSLADPTLIQGSFRFAYQIQSAFPQIATNGIQPMSTEFACFQNSTYTLHWMVSSRPMSETRYEFEVVSAAWGSTKWSRANPQRRKINPPSRRKLDHEP